MSTGMVAKTQDQVSHALEQPFQEALDRAQQSKLAYADETGWRENKQKGWLWVAVTALVTVFLVRTGRGKQAAKELLGEAFSGILVTDRWASCNWLEVTRRQLCWSHLKRDFTSFLDYGPEAKRLGEQLLAQRRKLFRYWHRARDGTLTRAELQLLSKPAQRRIVSLLEEGEGLSNKKISGMCRVLGLGVQSKSVISWRITRSCAGGGTARVSVLLTTQGERLLSASRAGTLSLE